MEENHPQDHDTEHKEVVSQDSSEKKKGGAGKKALIFILILLAFAAAGFGYITYKKAQEKAALEALLAGDTIYPGIEIAGYAVSGMTKEEAEVFLEAQLQEKEQIIRLVYEGETWEYPYTKFSVSYQVKQAVAEAYEIGRNGSLAERKAILDQLETEGKMIALPVAFNRTVLEKEIASLAETINQDPENASLVKQAGSKNVTVVGGAAGKAVAEAAAVEAVHTALENLDTSKITLPVTVTEPKVTAEVFDFPISLIGSYTTAYTGAASTGRNVNLQVGCEKIDGTVLMPGDEFDINKLFGDQTYENGYRVAAVIVDGKLEQGLGGGVCQITTTVYNAVIRAELTVKERHNHSLAVGYVSSGLDAAVAGNYKNLRFINSTEYPVYVEAYAENGSLVTNIYGYEEHDDNRRVEFERQYVATYPKPEEKVTLDPERYTDEREVTYEGKTGFKITVYKVVYEGDKEVSREWFSDSVYRAVADEVTIGTKVREEVPATPPETTEEPVLGGDTPVVAPEEPVLPEETPQTEPENQVEEFPEVDVAEGV